MAERPASALRQVQLRLVQAALALLTLYGVYCYLHGFVRGEQPDAMNAFVSALAQWAIWLLLAPLAAAQVFHIGATQKVPQRLLLHAVFRCFPLVLCALAVRGGLEWTARGPDLLHLFYYHLPVHFAALLATVALSVWFWWGEITATQLATGGTPENPRLAVMTARGTHVLSAADIDSLAAGGNYIDVVAGDARYLMRATMKELESKLAGSMLVRTHRSHFANVQKAVRLEHRASGNHLLVLAGGEKVPVSKAYRDGVRVAMRRFGGSVHAPEPVAGN